MHLLYLSYPSLQQRSETDLMQSRPSGGWEACSESGTIRRDRVFRFNRMLRKLGLNARPVSPRADHWSELAKASVLELPAQAKKMLGK